MAPIWWLFTFTVKKPWHQNTKNGFSQLFSFFLWNDLSINVLHWNASPPSHLVKWYLYSWLRSYWCKEGIVLVVIKLLQVIGWAKLTSLGLKGEDGQIKNGCLATIDWSALILQRGAGWAEVKGRIKGGVKYLIRWQIKERTRRDKTHKAFSKSCLNHVNAIDWSFQLVIFDGKGLQQKF